MSRLSTCAFLAVLFFESSGARAAAPPLVLNPSTQKAGGRTYFYFSVVLSPAVVLPDLDPERAPPAEGLRRRLARLPRLVPADTKTHSVCSWLPLPLTGQSDRWLRFTGVLQGEGKAEFRLHYPVEKKDAGKQEWTEIPLTVDFGEARQLDPFTLGRSRDTLPLLRDLEGFWAEAQARQFAVLEAQTPEFGFYGFAREAVGRKYNVPAQPLLKPILLSRQEEALRLYEMTTGATALTESLARRRLLSPTNSKRSERLFSIRKVDGITIAEHPWKKMMAEKKPAVEPLARLVPHDNYYVAFKSIRKFIEFGELSEQWGANLIQAFEVNSRDYDLKRRYEKQLCLRSTVLGKTRGPLVIRGIAVTGNDLYLREGSDVSVIFHVRQRGLFFAAVEPFVEEARKEYGKQLKHGKDKYKGVAVESFVTPLREVSLHRAAVGEFVVYSNSPVAVRRILDAHAGRGKALAEALDFQYMRTVFRAGDKSEDGFVFLSDAFIRQLVGPASKIKEKRRLEALTTLHMLTNGAVFTAWDTGKLPKDHAALLSAARLRPEHLDVPESKAARWDAERQVAVSDAYGTILFATPLIELPIDKITWEERTEYGEFRNNYLRIWRRYFDPVGTRLALKDTEVRLEVYILPLIAGEGYDFLRQWSAGGTLRMNPALLSSKALFQYTMRIAPLQPASSHKDALGDWLFLRLDDGDQYRRWLEYQIKRELKGKSAGWQEEGRLFLESPLTFGIQIGQQKAFDDLLAQVRGWFELFIEGQRRIVQEGPRKPPYKGVTIQRVRFDPDSEFAKEFSKPGTPVEKRFAPTIYHAKVDGAWYASFRVECLHDVIDRAVARRKDKPATKEGVPINSSVYFAPQAAVKAAGALRAYLEWESHRRALANEPLWYALYRSGVVAKDASPKEAAASARRFFGFVPVSPDGAAYRYDSRRDEVVNARQGSLRQPRLHAELAAAAPLAKLLEQLRTVRADLRFREDGIHTVLTIQRKPPRK